MSLETCREAGVSSRPARVQTIESPLFVILISMFSGMVVFVLTYKYTFFAEIMEE